MNKKLYPILLTIIALMMTACQTTPLAEDQGQVIESLQLTTRAGEGQDYLNGVLTLVIDIEGQPVELEYGYHPDGTWKLDPDSAAPLLLSGYNYPAYAYGKVSVPWGIDGGEFIPVTWTGTLTPVVTGVSTAQAEITLTPATACFHITLHGAYSEAEPLIGFRVTPQVKRYAEDANGLVWNNIGPADNPYTTPRTLKTGDNTEGWLLSDNSQSWARYPAGQTIAAGQPLFTLWAETPEAQQVYGTVPYTVLAPADLTLEAGRRYNYTLRLDPGSHTATITSATIDGFTPSGDINKRGYTGITTAQDLIDFAREYKTDPDAAMTNWADVDRTIRLLNDIDMTGRTDYEMIRNFQHTFDGGGHTITGLKVESSDNLAGMFRITNASTVIKNLHLRDAHIESTYAGVSEAGGIAVANHGTISGCTVHGEVIGSRAGGIVCNNNPSGQIIACGFQGTITGTNANNIGGIAQSNEGTITGCYALSNAATNPIASTTGDGTTTGCIGQGTNYQLTAADVALMNNALFNAGANVHWLRTSATGQVTLMPGADASLKKYIINTAEDLIAFANAWNEGRGAPWLDATGTIYLGADITLPPDTEWMPIGGAPNYIHFTTNFDGRGHRVSGVKGTDAGGHNSDFGFFYHIAPSATVKNLLVEVYIDILSPAGGIACNNVGTITSCGVHGRVNSNSASGGIVMVNGGTITGCYSVAIVTSPDNWAAGGIVCNNFGTITHCYWWQHPDGNAEWGISNLQSNEGATRFTSESATINAWEARP